MNLPNVAALLFCRTASDDGPLREPDLNGVIGSVSLDGVILDLHLTTVIDTDVGKHTIALEFVGPDQGRLWRKEVVRFCSGATEVDSEVIPTHSLCTVRGDYEARVLIDGEVHGRARLTVA